MSKAITYIKMINICKFENLILVKGGIHAKNLCPETLQRKKKEWKTLTTMNMQRQLIATLALQLITFCNRNYFYAFACIANSFAVAHFFVFHSLFIYNLFGWSGKSFCLFFDNRCFSGVWPASDLFIGHTCKYLL